MTFVTLSRACEAAKVPGGERVTLPAGARVELVQTLGGYTVKAEGLGMLRIQAGEADALGLPKPHAEAGGGVRLSEFAAGKLLKLMEAEGKSGYGVRVSAVRGESGAYSYQMDFEQAPGAEDVGSEHHGLMVFYARVEEELLEGVFIDFRESAEGAGFVMKAPKRPVKGLGMNTPEGSLERRVWDQLKTCYDPEIPVNIVDLGLIYRIDLEPLHKGGYAAEVEMTLTAPGCSMGEVLKEDVKQKLLGFPEIKRANVQLVFDPPWDKGMMSEAARLQLDL